MFVHATTVHSRRDVRIFLKECRALVTKYRDVSFVVGDGLGDESIDGIQVIDIGMKPSNRLVRMIRQPWRVYKHVLALKPDVFHFHDPELLLIGLPLVWRGVRVVYDSHEDVPRQILSKHWIPAGIRRVVSVAFECFENFVARRLSGVVAATPHIANRFSKVNPSTVSVNNYPLPAELAPNSNRQTRLRQICYVGGISEIRGIKSLILALPLVPDVTLVLCGRFSENEFESAMRSLPGWQQVDYRGQVNREMVRSVLSECSAGIVTLLPTSAYLDSLPIKMFEYMSAELPVIASDFPLWRQIIDGAGAGLCVDPESPDAIAAAIRQLVDDSALVERMGKAGRHGVLTRYNWPNEAEKLIHFYEGLL